LSRPLLMCTFCLPSPPHLCTSAGCTTHKHCMQPSTPQRQSHHSYTPHNPMLTAQPAPLLMNQVFTSIGQLEIFYDQAPDVMRSCSMALQLLSVCIGSYLSGEGGRVERRVGGCGGRLGGAGLLLGWLGGCWCNGVLGCCWAGWEGAGMMECWAAAGLAGRVLVFDRVLGCCWADCSC
jgi:hypothetical protein